MKAVIPAAGWGLRFLPLTKEQPKEMLPVVDKPTIQYVVEEALGRWHNGHRHHHRPAQAGHRGPLRPLLRAGVHPGDGATRRSTCAQVRAISNMADIHFIRQKEQRGLGDAVRMARQHIGDEPFAVMLGDTIYRSKVPVVKQLMDVHERTGRSVIAVEPVPREKVKDYGIVKGQRSSPT